MDQRQALIHFYLGIDTNDIDETARLWSRIEFALVWEDKIKIQEVVKG